MATSLIKNDFHQTFVGLLADIFNYSADVTEKSADMKNCAPVRGPGSKLLGPKMGKKG